MTAIDAAFSNLTSGTARGLIRSADVLHAQFLGDWWRIILYLFFVGVVYAGSGMKESITVAVMILSSAALMYFDLIPLAGHGLFYGVSVFLLAIVLFMGFVRER